MSVSKSRSAGNAVICPMSSWTSHVSFSSGLSGSTQEWTRSASFLFLETSKRLLVLASREGFKSGVASQELTPWGNLYSWQNIRLCMEYFLKLGRVWCQEVWEGLALSGSNPSVRNWCGITSDKKCAWSAPCPLSCGHDSSQEAGDGERGKNH